MNCISIYSLHKSHKNCVLYVLFEYNSIAGRRDSDRRTLTMG